MAVGLLTAVYLVGLSWVPAVVSKVIRAINRFLDSDSVSSSDEEDDAHTKAAKVKSRPPPPATSAFHGVLDCVVELTCLGVWGLPGGQEA